MYNLINIQITSNYCINSPKENFYKQNFFIEFSDIIQTPINENLELNTYNKIHNILKNFLIEKTIITPYEIININNKSTNLYQEILRIYKKDLKFEEFINLYISFMIKFNKTKFINNFILNNQTINIIDKLYYKEGSLFCSKLILTNDKNLRKFFNYLFKYSKFDLKYYCILNLILTTLFMKQIDFNRIILYLYFFFISESFKNTYMKLFLIEYNIFYGEEFYKNPNFYEFLELLETNSIKINSIQNVLYLVLKDNDKKKELIEYINNNKKIFKIYKNILTQSFDYSQYPNLNEIRTIFYKND